MSRTKRKRVAGRILRIADEKLIALYAALSRIRLSSSEPGALGGAAPVQRGRPEGTRLYAVATVTQEK